MSLEVLLTLSKYLTFLSSFAFVGLLLAMSLLTVNTEGSLSANSLALRRKASLIGLIWFFASLTFIIATLADILGVSFTDAIDVTTVRAFISRILIGQYLFAQTLVAFIAGYLILRLKRVIPTLFLLLISLVAIAAPALESHSASGGSHALAVGSMVLHVAGLTLWVGGLFALTFLSPEDRKMAVPRFSVMALWAAIVVVLSGLINAWARLNFREAWDSTYARVIILKTILTGVLLFMSYLHRKNLSLREKIDWRGLTRLITAEIALMAAVTAIGIWLSLNASPDRFIEPEIPAAPTFTRILWAYDPDVFFIGLLILAVALYIKGVVILKKRGDPRAILVALLHSKIGVLFTNPIIALALFDGSLFVLYFTDLFGTLMASHAGHLLMNIHFILAGFLFFMIIIGVDPSPRRIHHLVRIVILFAAMAIHAFFSISLLATTTLIDKGFYSSQNIPWLGAGILDDQRAGGSVSWAMGEIPIILALIATFILWMRDDAKETRRIDRNEERKAAMGEPDELAQYNEYLKSLNKREEK